MYPVTMDNAAKFRERSITDMIAGERAAKEAALQVSNDFRKVLYDLAFKLDGERIQDALRDDPIAVQGWSPTQWRSFFSGKSAWARDGAKKENPQIQRLEDTAEKSRKSAEHHRERAEKLQAQLSEAQKQIADLEAQLKGVRTQERKNSSKGKETPKPQAAPADTETQEGDDVKALGVYVNILAEIGEWKEPARPARFAKRLSGDELQWRRQSMALYFIAKYGICARMEVDHVVAVLSGLRSRATSLRKTIDALSDSKLMISQVIGLHRGSEESPVFKSSLTMVRLSKDGEDLCRVLGWDPVESEWQRVNRLHDGERFPEHTFGILAFAMHARFRGWQTQVLPEVGSGWQPDLMVERGDQRYYVEVELSEKENPSKWRSQAALQGNVAICALVKDKRAQLVSDCKQMKVPGVATDLKTLVAVRTKDIAPETPLWDEEWK